MRSKLLLVIFIVFLFVSPISSEIIKSNSIFETTSLSTLCKVWGFLKYYHPEVVKGNLDWDEVLLTSIADFKNAENLESLKSNAHAILLRAGSLNYLDFQNTQPSQAETDNTFQWIDNKEVFDWHTILILKILREYGVKTDQYYVDSVDFVENTTYENEKKYVDPEFPDENMRLLSLFRYWNIIHYFFPYKDVVGRDWEKVLEEYIPKVINANNAMEYHLVMRKFTAEINDGHAFFYSKEFDDFKGIYFPPFRVRFIENQTIVTEVFSNLIGSQSSVEAGDVILRCDGQDIEELRSDVRQYQVASNEVTLEYYVSGNLFRGNSEYFNITVQRDGKEKNYYLKRYLYEQRQREIENLDLKKSKYEILPGNIGYVNMGLVSEAEAGYLYIDIRDTKGIIFDIRNYPQGSLFKFTNALNPIATDFVYFTIPDLKHPGLFETTENHKAGLELYNHNYYEGKVIIIVDERTQSHAEFTCMALQTAPNVTTIGSQTAGADGNVSNVFLPGGIQTYFTGIGVFYPDGTPTQRVGVKIDVTVRPTIRGIKEKKDELLEYAINLINNEH